MKRNVVNFSGSQSGLAEWDSRRLEQEVVRSKFMLDAILENTDDLIWSVDCEYKLQYFNTHFKKFVHDLTGKTAEPCGDLKDLIPEPDQEDLLILCSRTLRGEKFSVERKRNDGGNKTVVEYYFNPIFNESAEVTGVSAFMRNITARKKYNKNLLESDSRYKALVEQASDSIFIANKSGDYIDVNPSACKLLGYDTEQKKAEGELHGSEKRFRALVENNDSIIMLLDKDLHLTYQSPSADRITGRTIKEGKELLSEVDPADIDGLKDCLIKARHEPGKAVQVKFRMRHKKGYAVWLEGTTTNLLDDPNVTSILLNIRDITERKKNEDKLTENELRYRSLIKQGTDAICITDSNSKYIYVNPSGCMMLGYTMEEFLKLSSTDLLLNDVKTDESAKSGLYERQLRKKDGTVMDVEANEKVLEDGGLIMFARDITERKKSEKEILYKNEQLRELSMHLQNIREEERTGIAREIHDELGQQLTALKMDALWIIKKITREDVVIHEKLTSMISIIDQTVTRVRRISSDLRPSILDDLGLLPALEWQCHEFGAQTGIASECHFCVDNFQLERNLSTNIFRIFQEALTNIVRHAHATKVVTRLEEKNGFMVLSIRDNGVGFDPMDTKNRNSWGLVGMRERALMFQIELTIESEKANGTLLSLKIPLLKKSAAHENSDCR